MRMNTVLIIVALGAELSSMFQAVYKEGNDAAFVLLLIQHAAASLVLAWLVWARMPEKLRHPRSKVVLLLFNFAFFVPVLGLPGALVAAFMANFRRRTVASQVYASLTLPEFSVPRREADGKFSQLGIKSRLEHTSIPAPQRLQSLLALQSMPPKISSPLLHNMLGDASDDIRLVAYGLLDGREKKITAKINRELANLKTADEPERRMVCQKELAELYWELAYSGLAQGDLRVHALGQALFHADESLRLSPQEAGLLFLKGRVLHEMRRDDEAYQALLDAIAHGLPESRALPYIAEILFVRGDYRTVRTMLSRISALQVTPIMRGVIRFWVRPEAQGNAASKPAEEA